MDRLRLEYERKKRGVKVEELCAAAGMSRASYYRKCKGKTEFTQREIEAITRYLNLESPMGIFFTENVS